MGVRTTRYNARIFLTIFFGFYLSAYWIDWPTVARFAIYNPSWQSTRDFENSKFVQTGIANATFVILARNSETDELVHSLWELEDAFNHRYHYPYVFLNDIPFTEEFKRRTKAAVSSSASYGLVPPDQWHQPSFIEEERAARSREQMVKDHVVYGGSVSYRNMCRFYSGFFFNHELLRPYRYYWRVEPGIDFSCHVENDPFVYMEEHGKAYGWTMALYEGAKTIPTLWNATREFMHLYPEYIEEDNALAFISDDGGINYNLCHFWSNFEIADMDLLWRSEAYQKYFEFLDAKGGFYYERWGDAPVHSIAASLFLKKDKIHFFDDIAYKHGLFQHCPQGVAHEKGNCRCQRTSNFDDTHLSCKPRFGALFNSL